MGLQYSSAISELLKSIRTVPFTSLTIKDDKLSGVIQLLEYITLVNMVMS